MAKKNRRKSMLKQIDTVKRHGVVVTAGEKKKARLGYVKAREIAIKLANEYHYVFERGKNDWMVSTIEYPFVTAHDTVLASCIHLANTMMIAQIMYELFNGVNPVQPHLDWRQVFSKKN